MRTFILGATGKTGAQLVDLALLGGHQVTAFVRSPEKLPQGRPGLTAVRGSPADLDVMAEAMRGHDVVFSTLAPSMGEVLGSPSRRTWTMTGYTANVLQAMRRAGVQRYLGFSSAGLFPDQGLFVRMLSFPARHHMADLRTMETVIAESDVEWTIARPHWMGKGERADYRALGGALPATPRSLHYRGLARFLLDAAEDGQHVRETVGLAA